MRLRFKILLLLILLVGCTRGENQENNKEVKKENSKEVKKENTKYEQYIKTVSTWELYREPKKIETKVNIDIDKSKELPKNEFAKTTGEAIELGDSLVKKMLEGRYDSFLRRLFMFKSYEKSQLSKQEMQINNAKMGKYPSVLGLYKFIDGEIKDLKEHNIDSKDKANLENVIKLLNKILPKNELGKIAEIELIKDDLIDSPMYVLYTKSTNGMKLGINLAILDNEYYKNQEFLIHSIIHEFAHVFSMDKNQLISYYVIDNPDYVWELLDGYKEDSYLKKFYNTFWKDLPEGWTTTKYKSQKEMVDFYLLNFEVFSNGYASTNVHEDFAESFKFFITENIDFNSDYILEKKVKFFYQFPELVLLRLQILKNLTEK